MAPLALTQATQYKNAWRAFYVNTKQGAYQADQRVTTHPINMSVSDTKSGDASFDSITYNKGAAVLQQMAHFVGEDTFRDGIRKYLKDYRDKAARLNDFLSSLESSSGENLQQWTTDWINSAGVNTLTIDYQCKDGKISEFSLNQTAPDEYPFLREHQLQVALYNKQEDNKDEENQIVATNIVKVRVKGKTTQIVDLIGKHCPLFVYPNHDDWGYIKVQLDTKTLLLLPDNINTIKDPFVRSMFWQSLWDMVRDTQMPITQYLELTLKTISHENDLEILVQVLANIKTASQWLSASSQANSKAKTLLIELEQLMFRHIQLMDDGSDQQKIWFQQFTEIVQTEAGLNYLSKWLQGERNPQLLADDQDMRWDVIVSLSANGHLDSEDLIKLEQLRDPSDRGTMMVLAANASQPDLKIKAYWLDELMRNEERQTAARLKQSMKYLFPAAQSQLHRPFAERILTDLHYLDSHRGQPLVEQLVQTILPTLCTNDSVTLLNEAQQTMQNLGLIAQKGIRIAHQEDQRCIEINALIGDGVTNK